MIRPRHLLRLCATIARLLSLALVCTLLAPPARGEDSDRRWVVRPPDPQRRATAPTPQSFPCCLGGAASARAGADHVRPLSTLGPLSRRNGIEIASALAPSPRLSLRDTLRVAMIRVDFRTDRGGDSTTTPDGKFDLRTTETAPVDAPPHNRRFYERHIEALSRFYAAQSAGHLTITGSVFPTESDSAFHLGDTVDYGPWAIVADQVTVDVAAEAEALIMDAFTRAEASGQIDFTAFDAFIVIHAGADYQSDVNGDSPRDIPTFVLEFGEPVTIGGKRIERTMVAPETTTQDGYFGALNSIFAHEFGHILGLPDLYNVRNGVPMVGLWSLMDSGTNLPAVLVDPSDNSEVEAFGVVPPSFDAWCRLQLWGDGFLAPLVDVVSESLDTALPAVIPSSRLALVELHDQEYYLIENRAIDLDGNGYPIIRQDRETGVVLGPEADSTLASLAGRFEYDVLLPSGGLLVWHIDDRVLFGDLSDPVGVNTRISRRGIRIIEADGIEDQGRRNLGTPWDPFYRGNNERFGPDTVPRTLSNDGHVTRIEISTDSAPDTVMTLRVRRPTAIAGWPIGLQLRIDRVSALDVTADGRNELLFRLAQDNRTYLLAVEGRGARPHPPSTVDGATPLVTYAGNFDPRIAVTTDFPGVGPLVAAADLGNGRLLAWNRQGTRLESGTALTAAHPITPPVVASQRIAFGDRDGGLGIAGPDGAGGLTLIHRAFPATSGGAPDTATGSVLLGPLAADGTLEAAFATSAGRVRIVTTTGAIEQPDGVSRLPDMGYTVEPIGAAPLALVAADFRGARDGVGAREYEIAAVDRTGRIQLIDICGARLPGWPQNLPAPMIGGPAAADVDGDGSAELVIADTLNTLTVWNADGSPARGFPRRLAARPTSAPLLADLDGDGAAEILLMTADGAFHAFTSGGRELDGFPLAFGGGRLSMPNLVDLDGDGRLDVAAGSPDLRLIGTSLDVPWSDTLVAWGGELADGGRSGVLSRRLADGIADLPSSLVGEAVCYPNPARGDRMHIRVGLAAGQSARAAIFDVNGRPVAADLRPTQEGIAGEAEIRWPLAGVAPGVYLVRLDFEGPRAPERIWRRVAVVP